VAPGAAAGPARRRAAQAAGADPGGDRDGRGVVGDVLAHPLRGRGEGGAPGPGPGPRLRADPHAAAPAVGVDGEPRRPAPTRGDVPRVVGPRARRCVVSARDEVLARIRAANAAAGHPAPPEVPRDYRRAGAHPAGAPELLDLFRDRLVDYKATVLDAA